MNLGLRGYPVCMTHHAVFKQFASNPVVLAGDTHNGWAFNMRDAKGMPLVLRLERPALRVLAWRRICQHHCNDAAGTQASSEELYDLDTSRRGGPILNSPETTTSTWRFVSTILEYLFDLRKHADCLQSG